MKNIKYTFVPEDYMEDGLINSEIMLANSADIVDEPIVFFNEEMELGTESIYEDDIDDDNIKYTSLNNLYDAIVAECEADTTDCIIANGFNISLDTIKDKYCEVVKKYDVTLSFNIITSKRKKDNFTIYIAGNADEIYSDEEWQEFKAENKKQFYDTIENGTSTNIKIIPIEDLYNAFQTGDFDIFEKNEYDESEVTAKKEETPKYPTIVKNDPRIIEDNDDDEYESYCYQKGKSFVEVGTYKNEESILIDTPEGMAEVPLELVDFLIESLERIKYDKKDR